MPKSKEKKDLCNSQISFRCTKSYKNKIKRLAEKEGVQQKEFIMNCIDDSGKMKTRTTKKERNMAAFVCEAQGFINHLRRNYQNDPYTEEVCDRLWEFLK